MNMSIIAVVIAAVIAIPLWILLIRLMPKNWIKEEKSASATQESYRKLFVLFILLELPLAGIIGGTLVFVLWLFSKIVMPGEADAIFILRPSLLIWSLFGFFMGLSLSILSLMSIFKSRLGVDHYAEFMCVVNSRYGFNAMKVSRSLCVCVLVVSIVLLPFPFYSYLVFKKGELVERHLFRIGSCSHAYSNVVEVIRCNNGRRHKISFNDGYLWDSDNGSCLLLNIDLGSRIASYVATASGKPITNNY